MGCFMDGRLSVTSCVSQEKRVALAEKLLERELARERRVAAVLQPPTAFLG